MRAALGALQVDDARHPFPPQEPGRPKALNLLGTMAHHPALIEAYHRFNAHLLFNTTLSLRQRELVVLRVSALRGSEYEHRQHQVLAYDVGLTEEEVERISVGPDAEGWSPADRALLRAADELVADARIGDETWAVLAADLDVQQVFDLIFTVGAYDLLAMFMRSVGVAVDDDLREWKRPSH